ncbi:MAG: GGGtGRT protein, partial [Cloacibacillus sp.]
MANFEGYERRIDKINEFLTANGFASLDDARELCLNSGIDIAAIVRGIQPIAFDNAVWAYTLGAAHAL